MGGSSKESYIALHEQIRSLGGGPPEPEKKPAAVPNGVPPSKPAVKPAVKPLPRVRVRVRARVRRGLCDVGRAGRRAQGTADELNGLQGRARPADGAATPQRRR
eukprot:gene36640-1535_t